MKIARYLTTRLEEELKHGYSGRGALNYFRTRDGMEIDYILEFDKRLIPIEVKWTENPDPMDARHLRTFLKEHADQASEGYLVCRVPPNWPTTSPRFPGGRFNLQ